MLESYLSAFGIIIQPFNLAMLGAGVLVGLIIGAIPAISNLFVLPLLIPFAFFLPPESILVLFTGIGATVFIGGSVTSILLNIPGTGPNSATVLDGYPMTQKGQGARAIGAAVISSVAGGILPVFLALIMIPLILPMILAFGQPEMAALVVCGLTFLAALSGKSVTKGIISGILGLLLSLIGYHTITGVHRFDFGTIILYDGINIVPLTLALFGITEIFSMVMEGRTAISQHNSSARLFSITEGIRDVWHHKLLWLRSTILGYIIGIIPGIGSQVASWVAYGHARQTSKNPEEFGTGRVEGIIAPQAANNAGEAGDLLTTMALGIPGSSAMAFFLAVFFIAGMSPGPIMMTENLPLVLALIITVALANIIGGVICLFSTNYLVKISKIHSDFLVPGILIVSLAAIYVATQSIANFIIILVFTLLGYLMKKFDYSRPALLLGFVLGDLFERYTILSIKIHGLDAFSRPVFITILVIAILILLFPKITQALSKLRRRGSVR